MKSKRLSEAILLIAVIGGIFLLIALDPSGRLFESIMAKLWIGFLFLCGLTLLYFVVIFVFFTGKEPWNSKAIDTRPDFFEEMQSMLRTNLIPLGFRESKGPMGRMRTVVYTNGNLSVKLDLDIMDSLYYLQAGSNLESGSFLMDFFLEGHISQAGKFKDDSMAHLNEWLIRNELRERVQSSV